MQKSKKLIFLFFILFSFLFISACQDTQDEVEEETEISCFANRIDYYDESGQLIRYAKRAYTQDKKLLYDSTFNASNNSLQTADIITYNGNNYVSRSFRTRNGQLVLGYEWFYEQDKLVKIVVYDVNGNLQGQNVYTYTGGLNTKIEYYNSNNVLTGFSISEYNGQNIIKTSSYDGNNNLLSSIKYEYQSNVLFKEKLYNANEELTQYYVTTYVTSNQITTRTRQAYDGQENILPEKTILKYDSNNYTTYSMTQFAVNNYEESNYTITYNEYAYPTTLISQMKRVSEGVVVSENYNKRVNSDIQCY